MQLAQQPETVQILAVEDNPGDARLLLEALKEASVPNNLHVAASGGEALDLLFGHGAAGRKLSPDIVLLDLNLPDVSGHDVLNRIKSHPTLRRIPVVILTTSQDERDIARSYRGYANSYITKPQDYEQFISAVRSIEDFWLTTAKLPSTRSN